MPGSGPGLAPEGDEAADGLPPAPTGAPKAKEAARKKTQKAEKAETSLSATVQAQGRLLAAQAEQLSEQAEKLALQDQRIHHLEQRLAGLWEEGLPDRGAEVVADAVEDNQVSDVIEVKLVTSHAEDEGQLQELTAVYEFEQSMWDATLLLFFSKATNAMDQAVLLFGFILNLVLQLALLITVSYIMLENPYTQQTVQEMLAWRVRSGHAEPNFDDSSGKSLLTRLCNQELWSYEQAEFKLMYDYLYKDVPGYILSSLAIIMWILTVMVEFRRCVEQALAVIHLPAIVPPEVAAVHDAAGKIAIQGIQPTKRCMALAMLSVPRFAVMLWLALFGCQYLAQTVNLQDIVLNAVALAFIMDVDELIAHVLLTERLRSMLPRIRPLPCVATIRRGGPSTPMCCPPKDLVRYVLTAGLVTLALRLWLVPFDANVRGAAMALCGGFQDFSFDGGVADNVPVILQPASFAQDSWVSSCWDNDGTTEDAYLQRYYGARYNASVQGALNRTTVSGDYYHKLRMKHVLQFAYANYEGFGSSYICAAGTILGPQDKDTKLRACVDLPTSLKTALQAQSVTEGGEEAPVNCPRFNATDGCMDLQNPEVCLWTWLASKCDGTPPGDTKTKACDSTTDVQTQCDTWEYVFNKPHPTYNCIVRDFCTSADYNCLAVRGQYILHPSSWEAFVADSAPFTAPLQNVLMEWSGLDQHQVSLSVSHQAESQTALATLCMTNLPVEYKPLPNLTGASQLLSSIQRNHQYNQSAGVRNLTSVADAWEYEKTTDLLPSRCDLAAV